MDRTLGWVKLLRDPTPQTPISRLPTASALDVMLGRPKCMTQLTEPAPGRGSPRLEQPAAFVQMQVGVTANGNDAFAR